LYRPNIIAKQTRTKILVS